MSATVAGVAEFPQGRTSWSSTMALHEALVRAALDDAGGELDQVGALFTLSPRSDPYLVHAYALAERLGVDPEHCFTVEGGGAAPVMMLKLATDLVESGEVELAVLVAADLPLTGVSRSSYVERLSVAGPIHPSYEAPYGPSTVSMFALSATRYLFEHGRTTDDLREVALHDRRMAAEHPNAHMTKSMGAEGYEGSRWITEPLRLLDCAPVSDGGGAVVVTRSGRPGRPGVTVLGTGCTTSHAHLTKSANPARSGADVALARARRAAGDAPARLDLAFVYDCFTIAMLMNLEALGLAEPGRAADGFRDGRYDRDGEIPVNTHGGLLSHGHPARAGGMGNLIEAVVQLRGEAGPRQAPRSETALVHGMAGVFAGHGVALLGRE